jgi:ribosome recycling factor
MIDEIMQEAQEHFDNSLEAFRKEAAKLRTGRANPAILESVRVDYYGNMTPLNQIASIQVVDSRLLSVKPWEKNLSAAIEKAIVNSDLGVTPSNRGDAVLVPIPALTGERRRDLSRRLRSEAEHTKVSIRNGRRDALDMLDAIDDMSEDELHRARKSVQELVDKATTRVDSAADAKEKEILDGP